MILQNAVSPQNFINKVILIIILMQQIIKTFFYLRIFETLSYIVTMINRVVYDLRIFLLFYGILIFFFSLIFGVMGVGNHYVEGGFREMWLSESESQGTDMPEGVPLEEYNKINLFFGYIFTTLRLSLGDYDFGASNYLTVAENNLYWLLWFLVLVITNIIFLNFIIAEASASYESVKERLDAEIFKERASLISEAEYMLPTRFKTNNTFPKYVIIREISN